MQIAILLLLAACTAEPKPAPDTATAALPQDGDGDGWFAPEDCDDGDPSVHPDAPEACNGEDENCDGTADEGLPQTPWYPDADGDGWGITTGAVTACVAPDAYAAVAGDCDDTDPDVHPEALDLAGDGLDANCDEDYTCETLAVYDGDLALEADAPEAVAAAFCSEYNAVSGGLYVFRTPLLNLTSLSCLCSVGALISVRENDALDSLAGLERIVTVDEGITVTDCPSLSSLTGLEGVQRAPRVYLEYLPLLRDLEGLQGLRSADTLSLLVLGIGTLTGLRNFDPAPATITLEGLDSLSSMDGVPPAPAMTSFAAYAMASYDLAALRGTASIGTLYLADFSNLADLSDLESLEVVRGDLTLDVILSLTDLTGLESLTTVGGTLSVGDAGSSLTGLENLTSVGGLSVGGDGLISLEPLTLEVVPGAVGVGVSSTLTSLKGLDRLLSVGDHLYLGDLDTLVNVDDLAALRSVGGYVYITRNATLTSLSGLANLESIGGDLYVTDNPSLSTAEAEALVDAIGRDNIGGAVYISGNGP